MEKKLCYIQKLAAMYYKSKIRAKTIKLFKKYIGINLYNLC